MLDILNTLKVIFISITLCYIISWYSEAYIIRFSHATLQIKIIMQLQGNSNWIFFLEIVQNLDIRYVVLSIASLLHKLVHVHFLGCNILLIFSTCCSDEFCQYKMTALTCFPTNGKMICILIFLLGFHISPCCNPCVYRYTCKDNIKIASSVFSHAIIAYV